MADRTPAYRRLGHLVAEPQTDDDGEVVGSFAAELYECDTCRAVVWWSSIPDHTAWHQRARHDAPCDRPVIEDYTRALDLGGLPCVNCGHTYAAHGDPAHGDDDA